MPIKEFITISALIMSGWFVTGGYSGMMKNIHKFQIQVLREVGRTDNWGNPDIFRK